MGALLAVFGTLLGLVIIFPGILVAWRLLFPYTVERARLCVERMSWQCFLLGCVTAFILLAPVIVLLVLSLEVTTIVGLTLLFVLFAFAGLGAAGLAAKIGERLVGHSDRGISPPVALPRGSAALELAAVFWLGGVTTVILLPPIAILLELPFKLVWTLGCSLFFIVLALAGLVAAKEAVKRGRQSTPHLSDTVASTATFFRGAVVLELAVGFPIIGWFIVAPLTLITALGAAVFAVLRWMPKVATPAAHTFTGIKKAIMLSLILPWVLLLVAISISAVVFLLRGAVALEPAANLPAPVWFVVIAFYFITALGVLVFALLRWIPRMAAIARKRTRREMSVVLFAILIWVLPFVVVSLLAVAADDGPARAIPRENDPPVSEYADWPMHPIDSRYRGANALGAGDVNKDGFTDYVTNYEFSQRYVVSLHPGKDGNVNQPWPTVDVFKPQSPNDKKGVNPENAALGDIDGDGNIDVICAQGDASPLLEWWEGNEPGIRVIWGPDPDTSNVLDESAWIDAGRIPVTVNRGHFHWVVPYDVNGDGAKDIVAGGRVQDGNQLTAGVVWLEAPNTSNTPARRDLSMWQIHYIDPDQTSGHGFILTDVDKDGDDDIVLINADFDTPENEEALLWYENPGSGKSGILTIRPTSDYSVSIPNVAPIFSRTHWDKLDEPWADGSITGVWTWQTSWENDLFGHDFDDEDYPTGTVTTVRICSTLQTLLSTASNARPVIYDGSVKTGTVWSVNPGYKLYTQDITGLRTSWTWDDVRDLKFGISLRKNSLINTTECTQVYLEVEYDGPYGTGSIAQRSTWPKHTIYQGSEFSGKPQVVAVDLNNDGLEDLITQTDNDVYYFKKTGNNPVSYEMVIVPKDAKAQSFSRTLKVADLNSDGRLDIIGMLVHEKSIIPGNKAAVFWMEYSGDEPLADNWTTHVIKWGAGKTNWVAEFGEKWDQADLIDVDQDGDLDIVANCEEWWEDGWGISAFWDPNVSPAAAAVVWFENRLNEDPYTYTFLDGLCVIEAEHYTHLNDGTWLKRANYKGYGGDGYMQDHNAAESGARKWEDSYGLQYVFNVDGGAYYLWLRQWVPSKWGNIVAFLGGVNSSSAWIKIDNDSIGEIYNNANNVFDEWTWIRTSNPIYLAGGSHVLTVRVREGGYALDRIVLTPDDDFTPFGVGPEETLYNP